jgi:hypothetical protein
MKLLKTIFNVIWKNVVQGCPLSPSHSRLITNVHVVCYRARTGYWYVGMVTRYRIITRDLSKLTIFIYPMFSTNVLHADLRATKTIPYNRVISLTAFTHSLSPSRRVVTRPFAPRGSAFCRTKLYRVSLAHGRKYLATRSHSAVAGVRLK